MIERGGAMIHYFRSLFRRRREPAPMRQRLLAVYILNLSV